MKDIKNVKLIKQYDDLLNWINKYDNNCYKI
jgi:hypothetical protein